MKGRQHDGVFSNQIIKHMFVVDNVVILSDPIMERARYWSCDVCLVIPPHSLDGRGCRVEFPIQIKGSKSNCGEMNKNII